MAAWGEMSARSVHMLGNRLFALKGSLNELEYQLCPGRAEADICTQLLRDIKRGVFELEGILQEFKDFVVATRLTLAPTDVNALVRRIVPGTVPRDSRVKLALALDRDLPPARADEEKLGRCLRELTENAVLVQPEGGQIRVTTRLAEAEETKCHHVSSSAGCIAIEFADRGPGVAAPDKERIFKPFYSTRAKGMGLGLAIVHSVLEAHGGEIVEVGAPGEGARFVLYLPAEPQSRPQSEPPAERSRAAREDGTGDVQDPGR
jgi:signal transduction histidine kinase